MSKPGQHEETDDDNEDLCVQEINNDSDSEDEDIKVTAKGRDDRSLIYNHAAEILIEADKQSQSQQQVLGSLHRLRQRVSSSPRHILMKTFCRTEEDFGVRFTGLEYAAYKNKREVVAFLVEVIVNECFSNVVKAGQYLDSLHLLLGMVMSRQRLTATLDLLLNLTVTYNGQQWLLFSPWAKNEEGKDMMDILRKNTAMPEGSRRCLETELGARLEALRAAQIPCLCDMEVHVNQYLPLLPQLGQHLSLGDVNNDDVLASEQDGASSPDDDSTREAEEDESNSHDDDNVRDVEQEGTNSCEGVGLSLGIWAKQRMQRNQPE